MAELREWLDDLYLVAASDSRVMCVDRTRRVLSEWRMWSSTSPDTWARVLVRDLSWAGISAEPHEARALLDAVAAWDADQTRGHDDDLREMLREVLDDAVTAIVGER